MKRKKYKRYDIEDPIYRSALTIFTGDNKEIKKYLISCGFDDYGDVQEGKYIKGEYTVIILNKIDVYTLTHELLHHCFAIFNSRGVPIEYENDEAFAYYFEMLLKTIIKNMKIK